MNSKSIFNSIGLKHVAAAISLFSCAALTEINAQSKHQFGLYLEPSFATFNTKSDILDISGSVNPSFGLAYQYNVNDIFGLRAFGSYGAKTINATAFPSVLEKYNIEKFEDQVKGSFLDMNLALKANVMKLENENIKPYMEVGFGSGFNLSSQSDNTIFLEDGKKAWGSASFASGAVGTTVNFENNMSLDVALTYRRYLGPVLDANYSITEKNSDRPDFYDVKSNMNQFGLRLILFFGKKKAKKVEEVVIPKGETKVDVLCSGPEYFSTKEHFRANSVAESPNQVNSKRMALSNARSEMAGSIQVTMKAVIDNYFQDMNVGDKQEYVGRYEGLSREVINQSLNGTKIICEEVTMTADGKYKTYLAIEMVGNELLQSINSRIASDDRLRTNYEYERFRNEFNKEMDKMNK
jgi:hypothetical protein